MTGATVGDGDLGLEAQRQLRLLHTLWQQAPEVALSAWLGDGPERQARGLRVYRANAQATAARALAAAFATVAALLGGETFNAVAARHWQQHPPERGDLAQFGADFASALADDPQLSDLPYLGDVARLDWAVHLCAMAADTPDSVAGLALLADTDPAELRLMLWPGLGLLSSAWPVVSIWQAHQPPAEAQLGLTALGLTAADKLAAAGQALAAQQAETALVWRNGWRPQVQALSDADARFTRALLNGDALAVALDTAAADFDFEPWLLSALRQAWIAAVVADPKPSA